MRRVPKRRAKKRVAVETTRVAADTTRVPAAATHADLVLRAARWLRNTKGCTVVFTEFTATRAEAPDAIGFQNERSILVECKVSRSDFAAEKNKAARRSPERGMGAERYYLVPAGLMHARELPEKWGLLWIRDGHIQVVRKSRGFPERARINEIRFLVSMLHRAELRIGPGTTINAWLKWENRPQQERLSPVEALVSK